MLTSLDEYVLIGQDSIQVECRRRVRDQLWETTIYAVGEQVTPKALHYRYRLQRFIGVSV